MNYETITVEIDARGVAALTLNVPEKHNALSAKMIAELTHAAAALGSDDKVRVIVLAGAGASFCAGGDLGWMRQQFEATRQQRIAEARKFAHMFKCLNEISKPLIGKVAGQALGGGIGLISVCDVVVGVDTAMFALSETRLGLIPATIGPYVIARIGEGQARQVFMSAKKFDANEAKTLGLLGRVVAADDLDSAVEAEVEPYLSTAPGAVAAAKAHARALGPVIDEAVIEGSIRRLANAWEGEEAQEGIAAFFEKRKPRWV